nr:MAG TPA: hypothetical protein [Caudoviricetes sp.]
MCACVVSWHALNTRCQNHGPLKTDYGYVKFNIHK